MLGPLQNFESQPDCAKSGTQAHEHIGELMRTDYTLLARSPLLQGGPRFTFLGDVRRRYAYGWTGIVKAAAGYNRGAPPMKLFKLEVSRGRAGREVLAHAQSEEQARSVVASKFTGWEIVSCIELPERPAYFVLAELEG